MSAAEYTCYYYRYYWSTHIIYTAGRICEVQCRCTVCTRVQKKNIYIYITWYVRSVYYNIRTYIIFIYVCGFNSRLSDTCGGGFGRRLYEWKRSKGDPTNPCQNTRTHIILYRQCIYVHDARTHTQTDTLWSADDVTPTNEYCYIPAAAALYMCIR